MKTNHTIYNIAAMAHLCLLTILPFSCVMDDYPTAETGTLTLRFATRAGESTSTEGPQHPNEHMRTLRVIVAEKSGTIRYNVKYDIDEGETQKVITFNDLAAAQTTFDVYAIANEELYGGTWSTLEELQKIELDGDDLKKMNDGIGKDYAAANALPQTKKEEVTVTPNKTNSATIQLDYAVAKVRLTIKNESAASQTVSNISIPNANMTTTSLFASGGEVTATSTSAISLSDMTIAAESQTTQECYIYECKLPDTGFSLTANWPNSKGQTITDASITSIPRGTVLDISVTLQADITPTINVQVVEWDTKTMDVPDFE